MFGFQRRRVRRCECETLLPKPGPLPHTSQTEAMIRSIGRGDRVGQRHAADENARRKVAACEAYRKPLPLRESPNRRIADHRTGRSGAGMSEVASMLRNVTTLRDPLVQVLGKKTG